MATNVSSGAISSLDAFGAFGADGLVGAAPIIPPGGVVITMSPPPPAPPPSPPPPPPTSPSFPTIVVSSGQTSTGIVLSGGGTITVVSGGTAVGTSVQSGALMMVTAGGVASGTVLSGYAALEYAYSGSTLIDTTVYSGGDINLQSGGHLQGLTTVNSGGAIAGATVDGGATLVLSAGAQLTGTTTISSGGTVVVGRGELISSFPTVIDGKLEIQSGGSVGSVALQLASGGTLQIDDTRAFIPIVTGFDTSNEIDLAAISFSPGATTLGYSSTGMIGSNTVGVLTVTGSGGMATLGLIGQYAAANFTTVADGHGGTAVYDTPSILCADPVQLSAAKTSS